MAQKTHPIGFRLGVRTQGSQPGYHRWKDLHGTSSRWTIQNGGVDRYAVLTQRDKVIKNLVEQFLEEDGYLVNKCIIHRTNTYVGVYVDVLRLEEQALTRTLFKPIAKKASSQIQKSGEQIIQATNQKDEAGTIREKTYSLQEYLSKHLEYGFPVIIQAYELNEYLSSNRIDGGNKTITTSPSNKPDSTVGIVDFRNAIKLAQSGYKGAKIVPGIDSHSKLSGNRSNVSYEAPLPLSNSRAKIVSYRLSGGRRHREVLRSIRKELAMGFQANTRSSQDVKAIVGENGKATAVVKGFQRILKGRISGSERSRILRYRSGPRPRHTVSAALDYGFAEVNTPSGKLSVTIRLYIG